jgi:hypothetical protein
LVKALSGTSSKVMLTIGRRFSMRAGRTGTSLAAARDSRAAGPGGRMAASKSPSGPARSPTRATADKGSLLAVRICTRLFISRPGGRSGSERADA